MIKIFEGKYWDETLNDVDRDVSEAFIKDFNPDMKDIPENEGTYTITITWTKD